MNVMKSIPIMKTVKPACYKTPSDIKMFLGGVILFTLVGILLVLPSIGNYGYKEKYKDPYDAAIEAGHFEDVVNNVQLHNFYCKKESCYFDITFWKPESKEYCEYIIILADKNNFDLEIKPTKIKEFDITRKWGWSIGLKWQIELLESLNGVNIDVKHQCSLLWKTTTQLYPSKNNDQVKKENRPKTPFPYDDYLKKDIK